MHRQSQFLLCLRELSTMERLPIAMPFLLEIAVVCAVAAPPAAPHRLRGASSSLAHHPCFLSPAAVVVPQHVPLPFLVEAHSFSQGVCCSVRPYYNSLSCLLLVGRCLTEVCKKRNIRSKGTQLGWKARGGSGGMEAEAHVTTPKTVFLDLAPMFAVPVALLRCSQLHLHSMCN